MGRNNDNHHMKELLLHGKHLGREDACKNGRGPGGSRSLCRYVELAEIHLVLLMIDMVSTSKCTSRVRVACARKTIQHHTHLPAILVGDFLVNLRRQDAVVEKVVVVIRLLFGNGNLCHPLYHAAADPTRNDHSHRISMVGNETLTCFCFKNKTNKILFIVGVEVTDGR